MHIIELYTLLNALANCTTLAGQKRDRTQSTKHISQGEGDNKEPKAFFSGGRTNGGDGGLDGHHTMHPSPVDLGQTGDGMVWGEREYTE